jgi:hypothetical protein
MIKITYKAIEEASKGLNPKRLSQEILFKNVSEFIMNFCSKRFKSEIIQKEDIRLDIIPYNSFGYKVKVTKENLTNIENIFVIRLQVSNIKSVVDGKNLGSLLYAESFLVHHNAYQVITREVPMMLWWETQKDWIESHLKKRKIFSYPELGSFIVENIQSVRLFLPFKAEIRGVIEGPILEGNISFY